MAPDKGGWSQIKGELLKHKVKIFFLGLGTLKVFWSYIQGHYPTKAAVAQIGSWIVLLDYRRNTIFDCDLVLLFLFDLILYISQSTIFQLCWEGSSWVEPVLSKD